jgi:hypothetical protein
VIPERRPSRISDVYVLAFVVHEISQTGVGKCTVPRRTIQRALHRAGGKQTSQCLSRLVEAGWLVCEKQRQIVKANRYRLGSLMDDADLHRHWVSWSSKVWSNQSILSHFSKSPLATHGSLNWSGVYVAQVLAATPQHQFTDSEVATASSGAVSLRTVRRHLQRLVEIGVVTVPAESRYQLAPDWKYALSLQERDSWESSRLQRISERTQHESERFQEMLNAGRMTSWQRAVLLAGKTCAVCLHAQATDAHEYPPKALRPRSFRPLWFPMCAACNRGQGRFLQLHPRATYEWVHVLRPANNLNQGITRAVMERHALAFSLAVQCGDVLAARSIAMRSIVLANGFE